MGFSWEVSLVCREYSIPQHHLLLTFFLLSFFFYHTLHKSPFGLARSFLLQLQNAVSAEGLIGAGVSLNASLWE